MEEPKQKRRKVEKEESADLQQSEKSDKNKEQDKREAKEEDEYVEENETRRVTRASIKNKYFLVTVRSVAAVYDTFVFLAQEVFFTTKQAAIAAGKKLFYKEVNERFRGGVTGVSGQEFKLEEIESYGRSFYMELWEDSCEGRGYAEPNGPIILQIYEILDGKPSSSTPLPKRLIYSLPKPNT
eukprot:CAMPEP_0174253506 /NCGR_PEP_ID=MMETSP0439-20130205/2870_1 /TAXON_ID=0 /ORGANISM="Stereomyxa ramosa, Strain Chinc5" /LENGTH=182 /DNA_ID=CAMNT_0015334561 /DNA_START=46 /DNA_END=594 /DNA_ORIENTATION=-